MGVPCMTHPVDRGHLIIPLETNGIPTSGGKWAGEKEVVTVFGMSSGTHNTRSSLLYMPLFTAHEFFRIQSVIKEEPKEDFELLEILRLPNGYETWMALDLGKSKVIETCRFVRTGTPYQLLGIMHCGGPTSCSYLLLLFQLVY